jgi:integrase
VRAVLSAAEGTRYAPLFTLLVNAGLRRGEALALQWSDVDLEAATLRVRGTLARVSGKLQVTEPKTAKSKRAVPLSEVAVLALRVMRTEQADERLRAGSRWHQTGFVFVTEFGEPCELRNALRAFKAAAKRAGLPSSVGLHSAAPPCRLSNDGQRCAPQDRLRHTRPRVGGHHRRHLWPREPGCISRGSGQTCGRTERVGSAANGGQTPTSKLFKIMAGYFVPLTRGDDGGSKQTRTADPLLVRQVL